MVIDDATGTAHDHTIMSSVIIYMHYVNCICAHRVCALRALVTELISIFTSVCAKFHDSFQKVNCYALRIYIIIITLR